MVSQSELLAFVEAKLAYEIDVVAAAEAQADGTAVIVDTRRQSSWDQGHVAGALHLPKEALGNGTADLPSDRTLIVYGWGPGCNGATHTARRLLTEGCDVREMIGGYEYWVRNGFAVEGATGSRTGSQTRSSRTCRLRLPRRRAAPRKAECGPSRA